MNKSLICLFLGTVIGAAGGFFAARSHYKKKFEKDLETASEEMEEYYRGTNEYSRVYREDVQNEEKEESSKMTKEEKENFKKAIKDKPNKIEYNKMYHSSSQNEIDEEDRLIEDARVCDEWHARNKERPPEIITEEEVEDLPEHIREEPLYYYMGDGVMTDDFDNIVDEPGLLIGDSLTKFNFDDPESEQDMMYVMNYQHDVCYIVQKMSGDFQS